MRLIVKSDGEQTQKKIENMATDIHATFWEADGDYVVDGEFRSWKLDDIISTVGVNRVEEPDGIFRPIKDEERPDDNPADEAVGTIYALALIGGGLWAAKELLD